MENVNPYLVCFKLIRAVFHVIATTPRTTTRLSSYWVLVIGIE